MLTQVRPKGKSHNIDATFQSPPRGTIYPESLLDDQVVANDVQGFIKDKVVGHAEKLLETASKTDRRDYRPPLDAHRRQEVEARYRL